MGKVREVPLSGSGAGWARLGGGGRSIWLGWVCVPVGGMFEAPVPRSPHM